jgi:glycosyltransferase involved in cell wall biosynthesis
MGLGWAFSSDSAKARALRPFIKRALRASLSAANTRTIVQNVDDAGVLADQRLTHPGFIRLIRGSGVDPNRYTASPPPAGPPLVVLPARLLIAGCGRVHAPPCSAGEARFAIVVGRHRIRQRCAPSRRFVGDGRRALGLAQRYSQGSRAATRLPRTFYGEGLPKALLEAAASARAIVATDVPGCREIVRPGENGWLVPPRDVPALAAALRSDCAADPRVMGRAAHGRASSPHVSSHRCCP